MLIGDDNDGQMIFGDLGGLKLPDICLTGEEKPRKNLSQETCPDQGSNRGPLRDRRACYHLSHSDGLSELLILNICINIFIIVVEPINYLREIRQYWPINVGRANQNLVS